MKPFASFTPFRLASKDTQEFSDVFIGGKTTLDSPQCRDEMQSAADRMMHRHPDVGAIVLECTNWPPYDDLVRRVTGLPVFDAVTMANHAYDGLAAGGF